MLDTLDRLMLAGLGIFSLTRERAQELFEEAVRRGQQQRADRDRFVKDLMDAAARARTDLEELVDRRLRATARSLNLPTRDDMLRIETKIDQLLSRQAPAAAPGQGETSRDTEAQSP